MGRLDKMKAFGGIRRRGGGDESGQGHERMNVNWKEKQRDEFRSGFLRDLSPCLMGFWAQM